MDIIYIKKMRGYGSMMTQPNKELGELIEQKRQLNRDEYEGKITQEEYRKKLQEIEDKIKLINKDTISVMTGILQKKSEFVEEKTKEITKRKKHVSTKKLGRKISKDSVMNIIIDGLADKQYDSEQKMIKYVKTIKPEMTDDKIKNRIRNTISLIKHKKHERFENFIWNKEEYLLKK